MGEVGAGNVVSAVSPTADACDAERLPEGPGDREERHRHHDTDDRGVRYCAADEPVGGRLVDGAV